MPEIHAFIPTINAVVAVSELVIGAMIYGQASVFRSRALTLLASSYILSAGISVTYTLSFPGAFTPGGLLGAGLSTTAWLAFFRLGAFPIAIIPYALLKSAEAATDAERAPVRVHMGVLSAVALAALATILATWGHDLLPRLFLDRREAFFPNLLVANTATIVLTILAMATLFLKRESVLDLWLLVALTAWLFELLLNLPLRERFTLGWYSLHGMILTSTLIVMLALIAESNRIYAQLALSTAEREHEREARVMSIQSMAAAIAHEVGQPLAGVILSAKAALNWLSRAQPDVERASMSVRETIDAGQRAFDVIKSLRTTFGKDAGTRSELDLNTLARETASLLDRKMTMQNVLVEFAMDETLPPILANKVQLQRVLVNLLTNAIESLSTIRHRPRRIAIRSVKLDDRSVLFEISDSGAGVAPDKMAQIFDPFFTTKSSGTGLGLSLSRTIVEEHGGRLWASSNPTYGVTFHLQMPWGQQPR